MSAAGAWADARGAAAAVGHPELAPVLYALAGEESDYDPAAVGDDGSSFGYTQWHKGGLSAVYPGAGLGDGHSTADLLDGPTNMRLTAAYLLARLGRGDSLADALDQWSTRPAVLARLGSGSIAPAPPVGVAPRATLVALGAAALGLYLLGEVA